MTPGYECHHRVKIKKNGQKEQKLLTKYSESFKQKVVKEVEEGKLSKHQVQKKYDIKGGSTIKKWKKTIYFGKK